jgi:hypothetical protein
MADEPDVPYWVLIAVLFSSRALTPALAYELHRVAYELYRRDEGERPLRGELAQGTVRNLRRELLLGTISGPAFEAELDTERGAAQVRFLLTRAGIERLAQQEPRAAMN